VKRIGVLVYKAVANIATKARRHEGVLWVGFRGVVASWRRGLDALGYPTLVLIAGVLVGSGSDLHAHDPSAAPITWNREVSRIFYERCAPCHRDGGSAFSLMTYQEAQPHASAIKDAVLSRRPVLRSFGLILTRTTFDTVSLRRSARESKSFERSTRIGTGTSLTDISWRPRGRASAWRSGRCGRRIISGG